MESFAFLIRSLERPVPQRGFTLVEMLVVLAIIAIVTSISLFGQSTFNRSILLTDTAYEIALSLRDMQSRGLSSRSFGGVANAGYGGRFTAATPSSFVLFADTGGAGALTNCPKGTSGQPDYKPGNCRYDVTDGEVQTFSISNRFALSHICGTLLVGGQRYCSNTDATFTALDVVFLRSNTTDSIMTVQRGGSQPLSKAEIYIRSADGVATRGICISQIGQVSVAYATCP